MSTRPLNEWNATADALREQVRRRNELYRVDLEAVRETARELAANGMPVSHVVERVRSGMIAASAQPISDRRRLAMGPLGRPPAARLSPRPIGENGPGVEVVG